MNFFDTLNDLQSRYGHRQETRDCYNDCVKLFSTYLQNLEKQMKSQAKKQSKKAFVDCAPKTTKSLLDQVKETGRVYDFGPNDAFVRKHWPTEVARIEAGIIQHLADSKTA